MSSESCNVDVGLREGAANVIRVVVTGAALIAIVAAMCNGARLKVPWGVLAVHDFQLPWLLCGLGALLARRLRRAHQPVLAPERSPSSPGYLFLLLLACLAFWVRSLFRSYELRLVTTAAAEYPPFGVTHAMYAALAVTLLLWNATGLRRYGRAGWATGSVLLLVAPMFGYVSQEMAKAFGAIALGLIGGRILFARPGRERVFGLVAFAVVGIGLAVWMDSGDGSWAGARIGPRLLKQFAPFSLVLWLMLLGAGFLKRRAGSWMEWTAYAMALLGFGLAGAEDAVGDAGALFFLPLCVVLASAGVDGLCRWRESATDGPPLRSITLLLVFLLAVSLVRAGLDRNVQPPPYVRNHAAWVQRVWPGGQPGSRP